MSKRKKITKLPRPSWDETFMALALTLAKRVSCRHHKIASIFVDEDHRIVATGYNGPSRGDVHCNEVGCAKIDGDPKTGKLRRCRGAHSEMNAVMNAGNPTRLKNSTLYITGTPCYDCMKALNNLGVKRIVCFADYIRISDGNTGRENENIEVIDLCKKRRIKIEKFKGDFSFFKDVFDGNKSIACDCE